MDEIQLPSGGQGPHVPRARTKALGRQAWGRSHQSLAGASPHGRPHPWRRIVIRAVMHLSSEMHICVCVLYLPGVPVALGLEARRAHQVPQPALDPFCSKLFLVTARLIKV